MSFGINVECFRRDSISPPVSIVTAIPRFFRLPSETFK
jgi:hypothetical protein